MIVSGQFICITGGTSGIGMELAKLFAQAGAHLILVSRHASELESVAAKLKTEFGVRVEIIEKDLAKSGAAADLIETLQQRNLGVDILVNNAGYGTYGDFLSTPIDAQVGIMELYMNAVTELCHALLQPMLQKNAGGILNIASIASAQALPYQAVYAASKAYMANFTEALNEECRESKVNITCFNPGPTQTRFFDHAHMKDRGKAILGRANAKDMAQTAMHSFLSGQVYVIPGVMNRLAIAGLRALPRAWSRRLARKLTQNS